MAKGINGKGKAEQVHPPSQFQVAEQLADKLMIYCVTQKPLAAAPLKMKIMDTLTEMRMSVQAENSQQIENLENSVVMLIKKLEDLPPEAMDDEFQASVQFVLDSIN